MPDDAVHIQGSIEGPISPVNYAGTQINVWGAPGDTWAHEIMQTANRNQNPKFGYMTEQMLDVMYFIVDRVRFDRFYNRL
jgi:hypothetical protein